jgi:hypothetical protein
MTATITTERPVEVGDIFASSWGYDQTNVDFYEVVSVTPSGKSVRIVPIGKEVVYGEGTAYTRVKAVPGSASPDAKPDTKRVRESSYGGLVIKVASYANAWRIDPDEEKYETGWGYGR